MFPGSTQRSLLQCRGFAALSRDLVASGWQSGRLAWFGLVWFGFVWSGLVLLGIGWSRQVWFSTGPPNPEIGKVYLVHFRAISSFHHPSLRHGMGINSFAWIRTHQTTASYIRSESGETSKCLSVRIFKV